MSLTVAADAGFILTATGSANLKLLGKTNNLLEKNKPKMNTTKLARRQSEDPGYYRRLVRPW